MNTGSSISTCRSPWWKPEAMAMNDCRSASVIFSGPVDLVLGEVEVVDVPALLQVPAVQRREVRQRLQVLVHILDDVVDVDVQAPRPGRTPRSPRTCSSLSARGPSRRTAVGLLRSATGQPPSSNSSLAEETSYEVLKMLSFNSSTTGNHATAHVRAPLARVNPHTRPAQPDPRAPAPTLGPKPRPGPGPARPRPRPRPGPGLAYSGIPGI